MASIMMNKSILTVSNSCLLPQQGSLNPCNKSFRVYFTSTSKNMDTRGMKVAKASQKDQEVEAVGNKYKEIKHDVLDTSKNIESKTNDGGQQASDALQNTEDKALEDIETTKKGAKEGAGSAAQAVQDAGGKAKDGIQGAWDSAKDAAQKVADS